jgi:hypothetical protein
LLVLLQIAIMFYLLFQIAITFFVGVVADRHLVLFVVSDRHHMLGHQIPANGPPVLAPLPRLLHHQPDPVQAAIL